jgi:hypothetical protein
MTFRVRILKFVHIATGDWQLATRRLPSKKIRHLNI